MMLIAKETGNIIPPPPQKKKKETGKILSCYIKLRNKLSEKKAANGILSWCDFYFLLNTCKCAYRQ